MKKKLFRLLLCFVYIMVFLNGCSGNPNFDLAYYDMIQTANGINYYRLDPSGEAQPPDRSRYDGTIEVHLVGFNGKMEKKHHYDAERYADDPEQLFLFFDGCIWGKEGSFDEWTVPHVW